MHGTEMEMGCVHVIQPIGSFQGCKDNSDKKLIFAKLKLTFQPNRLTNSTSFEADLFYGELVEAELNLLKRSSHKWVLREIRASKLLPPFFLSLIF
jgi:hypothetical protein